MLKTTGEESWAGWHMPTIIAFGMLRQ
jgi:hypothetical protein